MSLAKEVAGAKNKNLKDIMTSGRAGLELSREDGELGMQAARGGDVAGEHTVFFFGNGERIEITHRATTSVRPASSA